MLKITTDHTNKVERYAVRHDDLGFIFFSDFKASCNDFIRGFEVAKMIYTGDSDDD
jgi:hypothetical protein